MYVEKEIIKRDKYNLYSFAGGGDLLDIIEHALKSSDEFLYAISRKVDKILISRNQINRHYYKPFYDFNYPSYETCKEFIKNGRYSEVIFIIVLFDWYELYDKKMGLGAGYELALYLKRHKYIEQKIEILNENEKLFKIHYPDKAVTRQLDFNSIFDELDIENTDIYDDLDDLQDSFNQRLHFVDLYSYRDTIPIFENTKYTKYEIVNNFDIAYRAYKNGDRSNEVLSKLFSVGQGIIGESQFFLIFARHDIDCRYTESKKYYKNKYNILYINILFPKSTQQFEKYIDIPEYNLYVAAVKMNNKRIIKRLLNLFEEHGKFYKKMDLEKQIFIDEEIYEIPEVEPLNLITGDILNPCHELKKSNNI